MYWTTREPFEFLYYILIIREEITKFGYKITILFILLEVKVSVVLERLMDGERQMETVALTHNFFYSWSSNAVLSSRPYSVLFLLLCRGYSARGLLWALGPSGVPSHSLALFGTESLLAGHSQTARILRDICIYHFKTPTHFRSTTWLLPLIFTGASCAENLSLTARSRVNMQHLW